MTDPQPDQESFPASPSTAGAGDLSKAIASDLGGATGAARAGVDLAQHATRHTARQIVYALAHGAAEDAELRPLLRELASESERLSGDTVRLHSRLHEQERTARAAAADSGAPLAFALALKPLDAIRTDGHALQDEAVALRRRLPREYGDPLEIDSDWPTEETEADPQPEPSGEEDSWEARLRAWVASALDVRAPESRLAALRELVGFIEEAESPETFHGGSTTLLTDAYELGVVNGKTVGTPSDPGAYRLMLSEPTPENDRGTRGEGADGNPSSGEYLRTMILANLEAETAEPRFDTIREIARLVAQVPAATTLQGELVTALASAHEVGRRHGANGTHPGLG